MAKNPYAKTRPVSNPYWALTSPGYPGWTWKVLKLWKSPEASLADRYSRAFCATSSPFTYGEDELGDGYVAEIPGLTEILQHLATSGELANNAAKGE